jgi:hypothetical protein
MISKYQIPETVYTLSSLSQEWWVDWSGHHPTNNLNYRTILAWKKHE